MVDKLLWIVVFVLVYAIGFSISALIVWIAMGDPMAWLWAAIVAGCYLLALAIDEEKARWPRE